MANAALKKADKKEHVAYYRLHFFKRVLVDIKRNPGLYLMFLPVLVYYILFHYKSMYGSLIAFMDYIPGHKNIFENEWVGFENFRLFFSDRSFTRILVNTVRISIFNIILGFPAPIILALLLNELRAKRFSRVVQTVSYMPHFISLVVICGMIRDFTRADGIINIMLSYFGWKPVTMLAEPNLFLPVYVFSGIWQEMGYGSIIYLAALTGISQDLYEAARIDGANRWKQLLYVTLPSIAPTIITMLILRMGQVMNVGFEKVMLLYNPQIYQTADVISTFVYRAGLIQMQWSFSAAAGLFNSLVNFAMLILANTLSKRFSETSLW